ncbi:hypothetical protein [Saccharopolyspora phatthalungensis]|uniref:Lipoprotein n=1 Tax=Saccharopolyspora phatthalungensis TaxID=664693 RepID=A0A840Q5M3_9PSEU|nr:hypothetical protein [Saccharopolyspora phatthalungensis]MBB5155180.1 hypothetical protein [Saccharopolyspora phatthalungensis]
MPRARTRTAVLPAGLALIAALGACSAELPTQPSALLARPDPRPSAVGMLSQVIGKISERGSVHSSVRGSLGVVGELTAEGAVRYRGPDSDLTFGGQTRTTNSQPPQPIKLSIVDGVGYLNAPMVRPEPNKPWLKIAPGGEDLGAKLLSPALDQLHEAVDPRATFTGVEPATRIQTSAPDTVDGKPTTRYELRIITAQAAEVSADPQQRARFQQAADAGEAELGYQLWLDETGLPARFAATQDVAQAGKVSLTSTYRAWGTPTEIPVPPAEQVGTFRGHSARAPQTPR